MQATCAHCGDTFEARRRDQRFCSRRCNGASHRDSATETCSEDGCLRPVRAKRLCGSHYNQRHHPGRHKAEVVCSNCGAVVLKPQTNKYTDRYCSEACRDEHRWGERRLRREREAVEAKLPIIRGYRSWPGNPRPQPRPARSKPLTVGQCRNCAEWFIDVMPQARYCSEACGRKWMRRHRKARIYGATGTWTWAEFMTVFLIGARRCAYCDVHVEGQPEPDHVLALARGGSNSITNIVPSCRDCNCGKSDMTLSEWAEHRSGRGLSLVRTVLRHSDPRFRHLVICEPTVQRWNAQWMQSAVAPAAVPPAV